MVDLVIFTCEGREKLLKRTYESFKEKCSYSFRKTILAIDGQIASEVINFIQPDIIVQSFNRKGYVRNIMNAIKQIDASCFFWLEDDWIFHDPIKAEYFINLMNKNSNWAGIVFSKDGPLKQEAKESEYFGDNLYQNIHGFSTNPCFCNTNKLRSAFLLLEKAPKGNILGEDGFENFLTKTFIANKTICVIVDPVDHFSIAHDGYLETTPRTWHMTNSLETKTKTYLLTMPHPSFYRKIKMIVKLIIAFGKLSVLQLFNYKVYELCFRIIASSKTITNDD